jgi:hypothetical protein
MSWLNKRALEEPGTGNNSAIAESPTPAPRPAAPAPATPAAANGPVVLNATQQVWLQVSEKGGASLFAGLLQPGQSYTVPANATSPVLKTGKPEALKISVGSQVVGPVGPAATTVSNVSLLPADLMKLGHSAAQAASAPPPVATLGPGLAARRSRPAPPPPAPAPEQAPAPETNAAQ